ncbi:MAG TPA: glycosyltransferase family 4 protein [Jatrophihabitans sp.]
MRARLTFLAVRVLMLCWEYPPLVVGGLGRHVEALSRELVRAGHDVQVVTRGEKDEIVDEIVDGVHVRRAAVDPLAIDFTTESLLSWSQAHEHSLLRAALPLLRRRGRFDVVHAHDWLVAQAGTTLAAQTHAPLVATIHATEAGRHQGWLPQPLNRAIHSVERWLAGSADAVITCSRTAREESARLFDLDPVDIAVVPNAVDVPRWRASARARQQIRARRAGTGPLLAFAGRLMHEKGVQTLLDAVPPLRRRHPGLRLAVAGTGSYEDELYEQARRLRLLRTVDWLGFVPEAEVAALLGAADVVAVPSYYEPFGIVALEAVAARTPVVVAETGGLADLAADGIAAASFTPGDVTGLVDAIDTVLADPDRAHRNAARAGRVVARDYTWSAVADRTAQVYRAAGGRRVR